MAASAIAAQWQQEEFADVEVLLTVQQPQADPQAAQDLVLHRFPAHKIILGCSPYLKAQMLRWQHKRSREPSPTTEGRQPDKQQQQQQHDDTQHEQDHHQQQQSAAQGSREHAVGDASSSRSSSSSTRPQLVLTLQDASEQTAALAVLSSLYGVKPLTELLSELSQVQQLQAAVLADMWELPDVSTAAIQLLSNASEWTHAALQHYLQLPAIPPCLARLVGRAGMACLTAKDGPELLDHLTRVLLSVLGDLEEVWSDAGLKEILLGLELPVMMLLVSFGRLKVASEDTVLYTVQQYCNKLEPGLQQRAVDELAPLIRCQHLSQSWLVAAATCTAEGAAHIVIGRYRKQLKRVLSLRAAYSSTELSNLSVNHIRDLLPSDSPNNWCLKPHSLHTVDSVQLVWDVEVDAIRAAVTACCATREDSEPVDMVCPGSSPPLRGIAWSMRLCCEWSKDKGGACQISLYIVASNLLPEMIVKCQVAVAGPRVSGGCICKESGGSWTFTHQEPMLGWADFFGVGGMSGGWDEAAWAAQGWPTSGTITLKLTAQ